MCRNFYDLTINLAILRGMVIQLWIALNASSAGYGASFWPDLSPPVTIGHRPRTCHDSDVTPTLRYGRL